MAMRARESAERKASETEPGRSHQTRAVWPRQAGQERGRQCSESQRQQQPTRHTEQVFGPPARTPEERENQRGGNNSELPPLCMGDGQVVPPVGRDFVACLRS